MGSGKKKKERGMRVFLFLGDFALFSSLSLLLSSCFIERTIQAAAFFLRVSFFLDGWMDGRTDGRTIA